jgi:predicted DCC family thiol-disulfide oxidoreductase YuxK
MIILESFKESWNNYFYRDIPAESLAIFRILLGLLTLLTFIQDTTVMDMMWSKNGIISIESSLRDFSSFTIGLFKWIHPSDNMLKVFIGLQCIFLMMFIMGWKTRFATIASLILLTSFHQRNVYMLNSADVLIKILFLILCFAPTANTLSLDAKTAIVKGKPLKTSVSAWPVRLLQIQIAVLYITTVYAKLKGHTWWEGSALYYATRIEDLVRFPVPYLLDCKWFLTILTYITLVIELALGTLIFNKKLNHLIIFCGIFLHLGIEYTMSIPTFEWLMIICLFIMFPPESYRKLSGQLRRSKDLDNATLYFDGVCTLCNNTVDYFIAHDSNKRFRYASLQGNQAKKLPDEFKGLNTVVLEYRGHFYTKSHAILLALYLLGRPYSLLFIFRFIPSIFSDAIYDKIAHKRYQWFGKKDTCRLPSASEKELFLD